MHNFIQYHYYSRIKYTNRTMSKFEENITTYLGEIKKHGLGVDEALLRKVAKGLGSSNKNKYRAIFYAMVCKKLGKESIYN